MDYSVQQDLKSIRAMLHLSQTDLAEQLGVEQVTISRNETGSTRPSKPFLEDFYRFAFSKGIKLNRLKEMLWFESLSNGHKLLFHGAKKKIDGEISTQKGRPNNDFGLGFYTGERYDQAVSFISTFNESCVYLMDFDPSGLTWKQYNVDQDWMMTIAYYRGNLEEYCDHPEIKRLAAESRKYDFIIAPIADNRMFNIINAFIMGEITDEQCKHCLAATNLGYQYVFLTQRSVDKIHLKPVERCYICEDEKNYYKNYRNEEMKIGDDKVKLARIQYRGIGKYIDEILS